MNWRKPALYLVLIFIGFFLGTLATKARADESYLEVRGGTTAVRGLTVVMGLDLVFPDAAPGDADYRCGVVLVGPSTDYGVKQRQQAAVQCQIVDGYGRFDMGLGIAALQHTDTYNGSTVNFSLSIGYRITDRVSVQFQHWSNAGTVKPNKGRDMLTIGWRF